METMFSNKSVSEHKLHAHYAKEYTKFELNLFNDFSVEDIDNKFAKKGIKRGNNTHKIEQFHCG